MSEYGVAERSRLFLALAPYRSVFFPTDVAYSGCLRRNSAASGQITSTRRCCCFAYSKAVWASSEATPRPRMAGGTSVCQIVIQPWLSVSNSRYATSPRSSISNRLRVTRSGSWLMAQTQQSFPWSLCAAAAGIMTIHITVCSMQNALSVNSVPALTNLANFCAFLQAS